MASWNLCFAWTMLDLRCVCRSGAHVQKKREVRGAGEPKGPSYVTLARKICFSSRKTRLQNDAQLYLYSSWRVEFTLCLFESTALTKYVNLGSISPRKATQNVTHLRFLKNEAPRVNGHRFNKGVNCQHSIRLDVWMGLRGSSGACRGSGVLCGRLKGSLSVSEDSSTRTELKMVILKINIKPTGIWFIFWIKFIHSLKWLRDCVIHWT